MKQYELVELTNHGSGSWVCVIAEPAGTEVRFSWYTTQTADVIMDRAHRLIARLQADYGAKVKGRKAISHWHKLAATGSENDNLTIIKAKNRARIEGWMRSRGKQL